MMDSGHGRVFVRAFVNALLRAALVRAFGRLFYFASILFMLIDKISNDNVG